MRNIAEIIEDDRNGKKLSQTERQIAIAYVQGKYDAVRELKSCNNSNAMEVIDKIRDEIKQLPTRTRINWDGCCPDIDYPEIEYVNVSKKKLLSIIDKYKAESEDKE